MSAAPTPYNRQYDFETFQQNNPTTPLPAQEVDIELDAVQVAIATTQSRLAQIQRQDGQLYNGIVTTDSLGSSVLAILTTIGAVIRGAWVTATAYAIKDVITQTGNTYIAAVAHTSGTFATDLAAGKWVLLASNISLSQTQTFSNAAGQAAAVPTFIGQFGSQQDTGAIYLGSGVMAGNWTAFSVIAANIANGLISSAMITNTQSDQIALRDKISLHGADVASATTVVLSTASVTGDLIDVTGTTTITAITLAEGNERTVRFTGILTLTNGASLVLPGGANITTAAGDFAIFRGYAAGVVRCVGYQKASGLAVVTGSSALSGSLVQSIYAEDTRSATTPLTLANIPNDDTIPQSSEGTQVVSATITPTNASNLIRVRCNAIIAGSGTSQSILAAFNGSATDSFAVGSAYIASTAFPTTIALFRQFTAGGTSAITINIRAGIAGSSGTTNGSTSSRLFGGISATTLVLEEIKA